MTDADDSFRAGLTLSLVLVTGGLGFIVEEVTGSWIAGGAVAGAVLVGLYVAARGAIRRHRG